MFGLTPIEMPYTKTGMVVAAIEKHDFMVFHVNHSKQDRDKS